MSSTASGRVTSVSVALCVTPAPFVAAVRADFSVARGNVRAFIDCGARDDRPDGAGWAVVVAPLGAAADPVLLPGRAVLVPGAVEAFGSGEPDCCLRAPGRPRHREAAAAIGRPDPRTRPTSRRRPVVQTAPRGSSPARLSVPADQRRSAVCRWPARPDRSASSRVAEQRAAIQRCRDGPERNAPHIHGSEPTLPSWKTTRPSYREQRCAAATLEQARLRQAARPEQDRFAAAFREGVRRPRSRRYGQIADRARPAGERLGVARGFRDAACRTFRADTDQARTHHAHQAAGRRHGRGDIPDTFTVRTILPEAKFASTNSLSRSSWPRSA